jgi:DNA-binding NarL/FixJ family response regulator
VERLRPDVVLMDLQMPMDGLTPARAVLAAHPEVRILVLSGAMTAASAQEASAVGVAGYQLTDTDPEGLPPHVRAVAAGRTAWDPHVLALLKDEAGTAAPTAVTPPHIEGVPDRLRNAV